MRLPPALTLAALLVAGCGGDEPEPAPQETPQEEARPVPPVQRPSEPATQQPAPDTEPEAAPRPVERDLYTVQVAAFLDAGTARDWAERLRGQDLPVWTSEARVGGRAFHRLRVGALPSVAETYRLGELIQARYHWPYWVAPLTPADRLPVDAVEDTRRVLQGG